MVSKNVMYVGSETGETDRISLNAGPLTMVLEPDLGFLRYVRLGDGEILRGIYAAVRDHNWDTVSPVVEDLTVQTGHDAFEVRFQAVCRAGDVDFSWRGRIVGEAKGQVSYEMEGEARSTFRRNRIGFCVLHPASEVAGKSCSVLRTDSRVESGHFPEAISPHQPFQNMKSIAHEVIPGVTARVAFEGDVFEMEDQRNWTDASYKTYCTPLDLPFPVTLDAGAQVRQSVILSLSGKARAPSKGHGKAAVAFDVHPQEKFPIPSLGLGMASHGDSLTDQEVGRIKGLNLSHLRVDLHLSEADWVVGVQEATEACNRCGLELEAAVFVTDAAESELTALRGAVDRLEPPIARWLILNETGNSTSTRCVQTARSALMAYDPAAPFGGGTNAYFTELNRERPPVDSLDLVCFSLNPQVHAFDNSSLVETLPAQGWTAAGARDFSGGLPIAVTPVTLSPRFNPNATGPELDPGPGELPPAVDPRQMSLLAAGWIVGSFKHLAESGVSSVTYFETTGWRGVMERERGSPCPELFLSTPGSVFPIYHALADMGGMGNGHLLKSKSSDPLRADGFALVQDRRFRILLANLTHEPQRVKATYPGLPESLRVEVLDESTFERAVTAPEEFRSQRGENHEVPAAAPVGARLELELKPYAMVCVEGVRA